MGYEGDISVFEINRIHKERDKAITDLAASKAREQWLAEQLAKQHSKIPVGDQFMSGTVLCGADPAHWLKQAQEETG